MKQRDRVLLKHHYKIYCSKSIQTRQQVITTVKKLLFSRTNKSVTKNCRQDTC